MDTLGQSLSIFLTTMLLKKKSPSDPIFAQSWYDGFKKRKPEITLSKPQKLSVLRAKFTSEDALDKYFDALIKVMTPYGLEDKPENIWNVDETGLQMEHSPTNVVCQKGSTPQAITSNRAKTVTMIAAGSAVGTHLPPFYVFPGKRWNDDLLAGACPGAGGTVSETGWSNSQIFLQYLEKHFLKYAPTNDSPILILFDGHKSHVNLTLKEWGVEHNVIFFVLPPHTSHVTQPLDVGCFGPLKKIFFSECQSFMRNTPGIQINRLHIASISSKAYNKAMTPDNLVSSFRKTGIFPLERKQISPIKTAPSSIYNTETNEDNSTNETETPKNFLDQRKITKVKENEKKKKIQSTVQGNLMSPSNVSGPKCLVLEEKQEKTQAKLVRNAKKTTNHIEASPKQCTSGLGTKPLAPGILVDTTSDSDSTMDDVDPSKLCVICKRLTPEAFKSVFTIEFINWGQCDNCDGWVHLKYCTSVRVLRRGSSFLCPLCDRES